MNEVALITVTYKGKELTKLALINKATGNSFVRAVTSLLTEQVKKDTIGIARKGCPILIRLVCSYIYPKQIRPIIVPLAYI